MINQISNQKSTKPWLVDVLGRFSSIQKQKAAYLTRLLLVIILGASLRFYYLNRSGFPVGDGGLFYNMVEDLIRNSYRLPAFTSYNSANIPFIYPPLGIYLAAILHKVLKIDLLHIFKYVPYFSSVLTIPAFAYLGHQILKQYRQVIYATLVFALLSPSFEWLIMGGGLTRSPAYLFALLSLGFLLSYSSDSNIKKFILSILFAGLTGLSHLEMFWFLAISIAIIFANHFPKIRWSTPIFFLGGVVLLIFPYIFQVIRIHGWLPFQYAFLSGEFQVINSIGRLLFVFVTNERGFTLYAVLGLLGLFYCLLSKHYYLPFWFLALIFLDPRSASRTALVPFSLMAAIAIDLLIFQRFSEISIGNKHTSWANQRYIHLGQYKLAFNNCLLWGSITIILGYLGVSAMFSIYLGDLNSRPIDSADLKVMNWLTDNTLINSRVLVISGSGAWQTDFASEWLPAISKRVSVTTVQGTEWLANNHGKIDQYDRIKSCIYQDLECVIDWAQEYQIEFDYLFIPSTSRSKTELSTNPLVSDLTTSPDFSIILQQENNILFKANNPSWMPENNSSAN